MEPLEHEEQRQADWDRKCAAAPQCSCCGGSVYPHDTYAEIGEQVFCEKCFTICYTDDLEV